jgi:hypothetical protein
MMLRSEQSDEINPVNPKTPLDHFVALLQERNAKIKNGSHVTNHGTVRNDGKSEGVN